MNKLNELLQLREELEMEIKSIRRYMGRDGVLDFMRDIHQSNLIKLSSGLLEVNREIKELSK